MKFTDAILEKVFRDGSVALAHRGKVVAIATQANARSIEFIQASLDQAADEATGSRALKDVADNKTVLGVNKDGKPVAVIMHPDTYSDFKKSEPIGPVIEWSELKKMMEEPDPAERDRKIKDHFKRQLN